MIPLLSFVLVYSSVNYVDTFPAREGIDTLYIDF